MRLPHQAMPMLRNSPSVHPIAGVHALSYGSTILAPFRSLAGDIAHAAEDAGDKIKSAVNTGLSWSSRLALKGFCSSGQCVPVMSNFMSTNACGVGMRAACNAALDEWAGVGLIACPIIVNAIQPACDQYGSQNIRDNASVYAQQVCKNLC
jgi:hypothetical protein